MAIHTNRPPGRSQSGARPFRNAMLRGLAVLCPPLLTVLIIVWAINTTKSYFLEPVTGWARQSLTWYLKDIHYNPPANEDRQSLPNGEPVSRWVYDFVKDSDGISPATGEETYRRYVELKYLRPYYAIPFFLSVFILLLYFLGKFMAAGIGRFFGSLFERLVLHLPGVRAIYTAVKQVSDFVFSERQIKVTRIVAVEYPRKGIWSMGFVTSESLAEIHDAAAEPVLAVLIPYSPVPVTGCTITVRKSECIDLNLTFDQACQFIVSCGVVVPPPQIKHVQTEDGKEWRVESGE